jgi:8-oxo-dGTP pyrophosphatase MutT (NUDIX family)
VTVDLRELRAWEPSDGLQAELRGAFLRHAQQHPNPTSRECLPDHLTASALVISSDTTKVMLCLHRKVGLWLQFGGHIEQSDATLADAALREAREESGLADVQLVHLFPLQLDRHPAPCSRRARYHLDVQFLAVVDAAATPHISEESIDVQWFEVDALPMDTDDAVRRLVDAAVHRAG